jgi:putative component of membrane protein insertase Oxa1/YidC/SpoIIIJ protein YidD
MRRVLGVLMIMGGIAGIAARPANPLTVGADLALGFYQKLISPLQGGGICNFSPSCSNFSRQSYRLYGPLWGTLMTFDRLERCNNGAWTYRDQYYIGISSERLNDPPKNHHLPTRVRDAKTQGADGAPETREDK